MAESKESSFSSRELVGVLVFTLAAFPVVLVALALMKGGPGDAGGTASIARGLIESFGYVPTLLCGAGFAGVGAALLLSTREVEVAKHMSGVLFTAIGFAVILGSFQDTPEGVLHGGAFGLSTGGLLRGAVGAWAGALVGGSVLFAAIWLTWIGGGLELRQPNKSESEATLSEALTEKEADGVTAAEATALVPDESTLAYMEELWRRTTSNRPQAEPIPPSPYPDDVRLHGQVPEGAAPLRDSSDEPTQTAGEAHHAALEGGVAEAGDPAHVGAGQDLAGAAASDGSEEADPFREQAKEQALSAEAARALAGSHTDPKPPADPRIPEGARPLVDESVEVLSDGPPKPTWELDSEEDGPSVKLRRITEEAEQELEEEVSVLVEEEEEDPEAEVEEYEEEETGEDPEAEYEDDEEEEEAEYEDDPEAEYEEEDEEESPDAEYEEYEEEGDSDEDPEAEYEEEEDDEEEGEEDPDAEYEEYEEEEDSEEEPEAEYEEVSEDEDPDEVSTGEGDVVLQPQAGPEGDRSRSELVLESGNLFLEQGRVAVSLLQRRFSLEFDEACEVLDELQEVGLIGPYRGGQKRDILLSPEEWETLAATL